VYFSSRHHMGHHGSYIVGHGSLLEWVNGSWVTVSDPLPALPSTLVRASCFVFSVLICISCVNDIVLRSLTVD